MKVTQKCEGEKGEKMEMMYHIELLLQSCETRKVNSCVE